MSADTPDAAPGRDADSTDAAPGRDADSTDEWAWLEDVDSDRSLDWVRARNAERAADLAAGEGFAALRDRIRTALDSPERIPAVVSRGGLLYDFWRDADHERGVWRRTTPESFATDNPDWDVLLDLDALAVSEGENWVWHGATVWRGAAGSPGTGRWRRAMVSLSRGGADADVSREFDLETRTFVDGGFTRPESKGSVAWEDADTLIVSTDMGPGTMTTSGYPRTVHRWRRGTTLDDAERLAEGQADDVGTWGGHDSTPGFERTYVHRAVTFMTGRLSLVAGDGALQTLPAPDSTDKDVHREWATLRLREDWTTDGRTHPAGSLLGIRLDNLLAGSTDVQVLFTPTDTVSLADATWTRHHLVLTLLDDVVHRLEVLTPQPDGSFARHATTRRADAGTLAVRAVDPIDSDDLWVVTTGFTAPTTLSRVPIAEDGELGDAVPLKTLPALFDATGLEVEQRFATSADGTRIPYFLVRRPGHGPVPTLLYGYGGFEISLTPSYSPSLGIGWLEAGGAYALANIRGGGEYGPRWHQAALREKRPRAYEDFTAVARDLVAAGVTTSDRLGVQGGSNGGLLTGNMLVEYPELFGAVVVQVPLLDMKRYSHLLAGASWRDEYGDPDDPDDWAFLQSFSPYHRYDPARPTPPVLFTTSTRDDRVHPAHARKMAARMLAAGADVTYYENIEGGHGGAATNEQAAHMQALAYAFLRQRLGL